MTEASESSAAPSVGYDDILAAARRLEGQANRTPVFTSRTLDQRVGGRVFLKCENFQRAGAFKFRGAYNALSQLSDSERRRGALAFSSGNHAQAMALVGRILQIPTTIIMPDDAPQSKIAATREYGAEIILYDKTRTTREALCETIAAERGLVVIPPYNHPHIVAGQGTAAKELIEETGPLDWLLVPCGGGGLLSGSAIAAASLSPGCRVVGVEPERADDAARSFHTRTLQSVHNPDTIADGARTPHLGSITFPLVLRYAHDITTVSEEAIVRGMLFLMERMKLVVEPTGALGLAALLEGACRCDGLVSSDGFAPGDNSTSPNAFPTRDGPPPRIGVILSGGNLDLKNLDSLLKCKRPPNTIS